MGLDISFSREEAIEAGMEHWVNDEGLDTCIVRANRWGMTYKPLTEWLTYNAIEWSEFQYLEVDNVSNQFYRPRAVKLFG